MKKQNMRMSWLVLMTLAFIFSFQNTTSAQDQVVSLANGKKIVVHANKTWEYFKDVNYDFDFSKLNNNQIPSFLRGGISASRQTLVNAVKIYLEGWRYTMPKPKSSQAYWGNHDGRTTWWKGYWYNRKTCKYSRKRPTKEADGHFYGDSQNDKNYWSNGGSPGTPSKIDWLLSSSGGTKPY
ncbi:hypothetical protein L3073_04900 [Ancylomarina sp. DW003]|nr:hypothetical protein [Ancylomarina sp. DW003]MDE5421535.1 hypothetical protein [Ancylomarina sp. DW003]